MTSTQETTFEVVAIYWEAIQEKLARLQRKAQKLGLPAIEFHLTGEKGERKQFMGENAFMEPTYHTFTTVFVKIGHFAPPQIDGWHLVAHLIHDKEVFVRAMPGQEVPPTYQRADPVCQHCGTNRKRNDTYVLQHKDGVFTQVGKTCLRDFLGHRDPKLLLDWASIYHRIEQAFADEDDMRFLMGSKDWKQVDALYLNYVSQEIRAHGWVSGTMAKNNNKTSTANRASSTMYAGGLEGEWRGAPRIKPNKDDVGLAKRALDWALAIDVEGMYSTGVPNNNYNDYLVTLNKIARTIDEFGTIHYRMLGYAASIIPAYQKAMAKQREIEQCTQTHVGTIKKRQVFKVQLVREVGYETQWGFTSIYIFQDESGNKLVWKTGTYQNLEEGKWYEGKATVKDHDLYQGKPQTIITRCKFDEVQ